MKTLQTSKKYIEWMSAEDMHADSLQWLSQLRFIKDEHAFFDHLIETVSDELQQLDMFSSDKEIVDVLTRSLRNNELLITKVLKHEKELQIMLDGVDQLEDEAEYKQTHRNLTVKIDSFLKEYTMLKTQLFSIIKDIKKNEKLQTLLDRNH